MSGIESFRLPYDKSLNGLDKEFQLENYGKEKVEGGKEEPKQKVTIFSSFDDNKDEVANSSDATTKSFVDSSKSIFNASSLSSAEQKFLKGDVNSIWSKLASSVSVNSAKIECDEDSVESSRNQLDSSVKSALSEQIQEITNKVQAEYDKAIAQAKEDAAKAAEEEKAKAAEEEKAKAAEEEKAKAETSHHKLPVGMGTTIGNTADDISSTINAGIDAGIDLTGDVSTTAVKNAKVLKTIGKTAKVAGVATDVAFSVYNVKTAIDQAGGLTKADGSLNHDAADAATVEAFKGAGSTYGGYLGATLGSEIPVVGTVAGGYLGSKIGGVVGEGAGTTVVDVKNIMTDDSLSTTQKLSMTADAIADGKYKTVKGLVNMGAEMGGDIAKLGSGAVQWGAEKLGYDVSDSMKQFDKTVDSAVRMFASTTNAEISFMNGDWDSAKQEFQVAKDSAQEVGNAVDDGVTSAARTAKDGVKTAFKSAKFKVTNPSSLSGKAKSIANAGMDNAYNFASETYHATSSAYKDLKNGGKKLLRYMGW